MNEEKVYSVVSGLLMRGFATYVALRSAVVLALREVRMWAVGVLDRIDTFLYSMYSRAKEHLDQAKKKILSKYTGWTIDVEYEDVPNQ